MTDEPLEPFRFGESPIETIEHELERFDLVAAARRAVEQLEADTTAALTGAPAGTTSSEPLTLEKLQAALATIPEGMRQTAAHLDRCRKSLETFAREYFDEGPVKISPWQFQLLEDLAREPPIVYRFQHYYAPNVIRGFYGIVGEDGRPRLFPTRIPRKTKKAIRKRFIGDRLGPRERARLAHYKRRRRW